MPAASDINAKRRSDDRRFTLFNSVFPPVCDEALVWDVKPDHLLDLNTQTPKQFCCQCACGT